MGFQCGVLQKGLVLEVVATVGRAADRALGFHHHQCLGIAYWCQASAIPRQDRLCGQSLLQHLRVLHLVVTPLDSAERTAPRGVGAEARLRR